GYVIVGEAIDGKDGVEKFKELKPDIVTLDITMPVMDGLEALEEIRKLDNSVKVVMITAAGQKEKMVEALKHGASEFVTKPFAEEEVIKVMQNIMS
ncbi:MAG: response regulator, partial [Lachnospiraceae bacterium]|nr:response regulator [Lachnospiraceae bacterium]